MLPTKALSLLMERFPTLGLMANQLGTVKPVELPLPSTDLESFDLLYIHGLGTGKTYFQVKEWLKKDPERRLVYLEEEPGIIGSFLEQKWAPEILADPQVHLELFTPGSIDSLARRFPKQRVEVLGAKRGLRLEILRKTTIAHSLRYDRVHGDYLFQNFLQNLRHLPGSFYANGMKGTFQGTPAIICGAGPSLSPTIEALRGVENKALIIAGGSTLAALTSRGIKPHFGMALDPNHEEYLRMRNSFAFEVPLLYSTRVHPGTFQTMNGPFGYMRSGIGGLSELWIEEELGLQEPLLTDFSQEAMSVTAICIGWAQFLGCNPILLNGIDLAYTDKKRYSPGVAPETPFEEMDRNKANLDRLLKRKDRKGKMVYTAVRWVMESTAISDFAKRHPHVRFINTTEGGIGFKGIEYVPFEKAIQGFTERPLRSEVSTKIKQSPMPPNTAQIIEQKVAELKGSLGRVIDHLEILSGEKQGSKALAEVELPEEIAYVVLFSELYQVIEPGETFWKEALTMARRYTWSDSKIGSCQGGALFLSQA